MTSGRLNVCKPCIDPITKANGWRWRRSYGGVRRLLYTRIQMRIRHQPEYQERKLHFTWQEFDQWLSARELTYRTLFETWQESGWSRVFSPSIDRINNNKDYTLDNIQLLAQGDNARKDGGAWARKLKHAA